MDKLLLVVKQQEVIMLVEQVGNVVRLQTN